MVELYKKYRPKTLDQVIGQPDAVRVLKDFLARKELPHALLFTGGSGIGKTTLCRILKRELKCSNADFHEVNAADTRGIDTVREIRQRMGLHPLNGTCKIWLVDECHKVTSDAQTAMLKMLEDTPSHVYFMLATTDPDKLLKTIRTRCTEIKLGLIGGEELSLLLKSVIGKECEGLGYTSNDVIDRIIEAAEGSARQALVLLGSVIGLKSEEEQLACIAKPGLKKQAWDLLKALLYEKAVWTKVAEIIRTLEVDNVEQFRHYVLACCNTELLKAGKNCEKAFTIAQVFSDPSFDSKEIWLTRACFEIVGQRK
jgi:DNA polymerase III gamma/tau subunit